jgi:hypothetical protein
MFDEDTIYEDEFPENNEDYLEEPYADPCDDLGVEDPF